MQLRGDATNPYHLSVGFVCLDDKSVTLLKKQNGDYTLPRETIYSQENLEEALARGAQEELGTKVKMERFLGSLITNFTRTDGSNIEKTTLYFSVEKVGETSKNQESDELDDEVVEMNFVEACKLLRLQNNDEHLIIERLLTTLNPTNRL